MVRLGGGAGRDAIVTQRGTDRPVVLIVEDEFLVRKPAAEIISAAGYDVVEGFDADAAIMILENRRDIRVIITDIEVSGSMNGLKLAHAVKHRWPPIHIIASSAYHASLENDLPAGSVFLPKPYTEHKIVGALRALTAPGPCAARPVNDAKAADLTLAQT